MTLLSQLRYPAKTIVESPPNKPQTTREDLHQQPVEIYLKIGSSTKDNNKNQKIPVMKLQRDLLLTICNAFTLGVIKYNKSDNFVNSYSIGKIKRITDFQNSLTSSTTVAQMMHWQPVS